MCQSLPLVGLVGGIPDLNRLDRKDGRCTSGSHVSLCPSSAGCTDLGMFGAHTNKNDTYLCMTFEKDGCPSRFQEISRMGMV